MGNGRNAFAKQNPSAAFWCEAYKIMTVNARLPLAPKVVLLDEDFFVMEAAGKTLQGVAKEAEYAAVRHDAFEKAGQGLAQLHAAGLHHGRPALRDIAYDKETGTITFLDWENEKKFVDAPAPVLDLFLFLHSCFREEWPDNALIDAAVAGYSRVEGRVHHRPPYPLCLLSCPGPLRLDRRRLRRQSPSVYHRLIGQKRPQHSGYSRRGVPRRLSSSAGPGGWAAGRRRRGPSFPGARSPAPPGRRGWRR